MNYQLLYWGLGGVIALIALVSLYYDDETLSYVYVINHYTEEQRNTIIQIIKEAD